MTEYICCDFEDYFELLNEEIKIECVFTHIFTQSYLISLIEEYSCFPKDKYKKLLMLAKTDEIAEELIEKIKTASVSRIEINTDNLNSNKFNKLCINEKEEYELFMFNINYYESQKHTKKYVIEKRKETGKYVYENV